MSKSGSHGRRLSIRLLGGLIAVVLMAGIAFLAFSNKSFSPLPMPTQTSLISTATKPVPTVTHQIPDCRTVKTTTPTPTNSPTNAATTTVRPTTVATPYPTHNAIIDYAILRWFVGLGPGADPAQVTVEEAVLDDFWGAPERKYDHIFMDLEVVPRDAAKETLAIEVAAGNGPDIVGPVGWADANALPGEWMDLTSLIMTAQYNTGYIDPALLKMSRNDLGLLGLPFALYPAALEFNASLFEKAGLQPPPAKVGDPYTLPDGSQVDWDWETLAKIAQFLTLDSSGRNATQPGFDASQIVQYGFSWGHETHPALIASYWQAASLLAPGGAPGKHQAVVPEAWSSAWRWTYDGMHGPRPFVAFGSTAADSFEKGRTAMTIETTRYLSSFGKVKSFQFAALPAYHGQTSRRLDIEGFRLWKGTKAPDGAFFILAHLLDEGVHKLLVECNGFPPAYDALPVRGSDQQDFINIRRQQFPWVTTWDTLLAGVNDPETPAGEEHRPNFTDVWSRIAAFGVRLETIDNLDLPAEEGILERDLTILFNEQ